jgi:hypothetical protein
MTKFDRQHATPYPFRQRVLTGADSVCLPAQYKLGIVDPDVHAFDAHGASAKPQTGRGVL